MKCKTKEDEEEVEDFTQFVLSIGLQQLPDYLNEENLPIEGNHMANFPIPLTSNYKH